MASIFNLLIADFSDIHIDFESLYLSPSTPPEQRSDWCSGSRILRFQVGDLLTAQESGVVPSATPLLRGHSDHDWFDKLAVEFPSFNSESTIFVTHWHSEFD